LKAAIPAVAFVFGILLAGSITPAAHSMLNYEYVSDFGRFGILYEGRLSHPQSIAEDYEGNLYVTDLGNKRVQKFDSEGAYLDQWGRSGKANSEFHEPAGIAISGNLAYVVDRDLNRVQVFDLDGRYVSQWGERGIDEGQFFFPTGIAVGVNGTVYVADSGNQRIQAFSPSGEYLNTMGTAGSGHGKFLHLSDVTTDSEGNVYGTDRGHGKIDKFDPEGNHVSTIKYDSNNWQFSPSALDVAEDGSLFILNSADDRILHLEQDGHTTLMVHERLGPFPNFLNHGADVAITETGHLVTVDHLGHKVFKHNTPFVEKDVPAAATEEPAGEAVAGAEQTETEGTDDSGMISDACGQPLDNYNVITGTESGDIIEGTDGNDLIFALGGNDIVSGYEGNDCIFGGDGDDVIFGNEGSDGIFGDQGNDILKGSAGDDVIYGNYGLDSIDGGAGSDVCIAADTADQDMISNCES